MLRRASGVAFGGALACSWSQSTLEGAVPWCPMTDKPGSCASALSSTEYPKVTRDTSSNSWCLDQSNKDVRFIAERLPWYGPSHSPEVGEIKQTRFSSFYDIAGITEDPIAFRAVVELFVRRYRAATEAGFGPTKIAGFEPRGFIFGTAVALQLGIPFVMIGKAIGSGPNLPGILATSGKDRCESVVRLGSIMPGDRVVLLDDLIASGGTAIAGLDLVASLGGEVTEFAAVMAPTRLGGVKRIQGHDNGRFAGVSVFTLLEDETVQTLVGKTMDYTPPAGTPRTVTVEEGRKISERMLGGDGNVPLWP